MGGYYVQKLPSITLEGLKILKGIFEELDAVDLDKLNNLIITVIICRFLKNSLGI